MKSTLVTALLLAAASLSPVVANAAANPEEPKKVEKKESASVQKHEAAAAEQTKLHKEAKIPMEKARTIALSHVKHGKIESAELEREHGKLIYSFDIREAERKDVTEVNIDAMNGKVVAIDHETPKKEAIEKKQEAKENH